MYFFLRARHAERMAMIEKGTPSPDWKPAPSSNLLGVKIGMLFFGIGFGILIAYILHFILGVDQSALYPGMMFLFGGGSLVVSYFVELRLNQKDRI